MGSDGGRDVDSSAYSLTSQASAPFGLAGRQGRGVSLNAPILGKKLGALLSTSTRAVRPLALFDNGVIG